MSEPAHPGGPNAEQREFWNTRGASAWVELQELLDEQLAVFGTAVAEVVHARSGENVLDVGCGCGTTSLELAACVAPRGRVVGVDVSAPMIAHASERARRRGVANVEFVVADAQTHAFEPEVFDVLYSRFGVMFFDTPEAAFANLARALKPGARMGFCCWQSIEQNPWMREPTLAAMQHITIEIPSDPCAPGPFAFADADRVRRILEAAGFAGVTIDAFTPALRIGGSADLDAATAFIMRLGPMGRALAGADDATHRAVAGAVRDALAPYRTEQGTVETPSAAWIIRATRA